MQIHFDPRLPDAGPCGRRAAAVATAYSECAALDRHILTDLRIGIADRHPLPLTSPPVLLDFNARLLLRQS
jgi:hypothetical protein